MGVSVNIFNVPLGEIGPMVRHAEECGFERVWFGDHLITPVQQNSEHPRSDASTAKVLYEQTPLSDLLVTFGYLGGFTNVIGFATGIYILPLRHPVITARAVLTAQALSGGRVTFGVGAGWLREEFDVMGVPFGERGRRLDEMVEIMRALWTGEVVSHAGTTWSFDEVQLWPPAEPAVPLVFGGTSRAALMRTARLGDGWYSPSGFLLGDVLRARDEIEAFRVQHGTDGKPFTYHVRVEGDQTQANIARYQAEGFDSLVLPMTAQWRRQDLDWTTEARLELLSDRAAMAGLTA